MPVSVSRINNTCGNTILTHACCVNWLVVIVPVFQAFFFMPLFQKSSENQTCLQKNLQYPYNFINFIQTFQAGFGVSAQTSWQSKFSWITFRLPE